MEQDELNARLAGAERAPTNVLPSAREEGKLLLVLQLGSYSDPSPAQYGILLLSRQTKRLSSESCKLLWQCRLLFLHLTLTFFPLVFFTLLPTLVLSLSNFTSTPRLPHNDLILLIALCY